MAAQRREARSLLSCPSVRYTHESRINGSRYRNTLYTIGYTDVYSFFVAKFRNPYVHPEVCC